MTDKILDVGCGKRKYPNSIGIDINPSSHADFFEDARDMSFANNIFDMVYSAYVIQHIPEDEKVVKEIHRVLKANGLFIFKTIAFFHISKRHFPIPTVVLRKLHLGKLLYPYLRFYSKQDIRKLLKGFKIKEMHYSFENYGSITCVAEKIPKGR